MNELTDERLAEIAKRCEAATRGRWYVALDGRQERSGRKYGCDLWADIPVSERRAWQSAGYVPLAQIWYPSNPSSIHDPRAEVEAERNINADFIAHARTDVPALLAEIATLRAALAAQVEVTHTETTRLRGLLNDAHNKYHAERIELAALREHARALEEALERAADTFADFVRTFTLIQRPVVAAAANIAERDARALLDPPAPEPKGEA